ncbi:hypothetical protein C3L23_03450 [Nautilia sp. PV-1]|uniref:hypothetical protein n=1 Tax=Nautilia sp. PV-1 TaxID=2579250 RepID=UPI000FD8BD08|nr:hypothetical protein [Nautilia sp. PV-1]AZV46359.1 hypothetical protein C3L23_03450 [Nautilia sp. PV-1]
MKKFLLIFLLFFTGCSIKTAIKQDPLYEKTLTYTQRGQIINSLETKALIDAVYLNPLYPEKFTKPTFLIGVYNDFHNTLQNQEFKLTLNNTEPVKISKKIPSFILYKNFPFYNEWMNYYIVEFNQTQKPYVLEYKSKDWGEVKFTF